MSTDPKQLQAKLIEIVQQTIERDNTLRNKYEVKAKFRFVQDRLQTLLGSLESELKVQVEQSAPQRKVEIAPNEEIVYIYLFNAHGLNVRSWQNMLLPNVFYEYSVNRPIYQEKNYVESVIKAKANRVQHGYIAVAVKKDDIYRSQQESLQKDSYGNPLIKVREGALKFDKLISFFHNDVEYDVSDKSELIKK